MFTLGMLPYYKLPTETALDWTLIWAIHNHFLSSACSSILVRGRIWQLMYFTRCVLPRVHKPNLCTLGIYGQTTFQEFRHPRLSSFHLKGLRKFNSLRLRIETRNIRFHKDKSNAMPQVNIINSLLAVSMSHSS